MLLVCFIYAVMLGVIYVIRILVNDPERDALWGKEKELSHYKLYSQISSVEFQPDKKEYTKLS